jgi:hypothetical protein
MSSTRPLIWWTNLIGYQAVWFITVIGAAHGEAWPSMVAGGIFVLSQIVIAHTPRLELGVLAVAVIAGIVVDGVAAKMDWVRYAAPSPSIPAHAAPVWILMLWASFAMTINSSLAYLRDRWWLALALGAVGAPLAYLGAQRGWHAVTFQPPAWRGWLWIAVCWAVALPSLASLARRLSRAAHAALSLPEGLE